MGQEWPEPKRRPGSFNHPHQPRKRSAKKGGCLELISVPVVAIVGLVVLRKRRSG